MAKVSRKVILHIGSGKTGSTSIQASLSKHSVFGSIRFMKFGVFQQGEDSVTTT